MNIERNFYHAHDLPPMRPEELLAQNSGCAAASAWGWLALGILFVMLAIYCFGGRA